MNAVDLAVTFRRQLEKQDAAALRRITAAYRALYAGLQAEIEALAAKIDPANPMTRAEVARLAQYKDLLKQTEVELSKFGAYLEVELSTGARAALTMGERHARDLIIASLPGVRARIMPVSPDTISTLVGFLDRGGPLYKRLGQMPGYTTQKIADKIVEFVGLGRNPRELARFLRPSFGGGLTDALRFSRTVQLYSYREANRASYLANNAVVRGWIWMSALTPSTCMACVSKHGSFHELSERLNDHHNGYCSMLPVTRSMDGQIEFSGEDWKRALGRRHQPGWQGVNVSGTFKNGEEWFSRLPEQYQRRMMGDAKYDAWKSGQFKFSDLATEHDDDVYGKMTGATPLWQLLGAEPPR